MAYPAIVRTTLFVTFLVTALCASGAAAHHGKDPYDGVTPGSQNPPPKAESIGKGAVMVTWPGFQMLTTGASRFFIQVTEPVKVVTKKTQTKFVLTLRNTRVHLKNNWRPLETEFFDTPVTRAEVKRSGKRDLQMVFELREPVTPTVTEERAKDGYFYVFVDFE